MTFEQYLRAEHARSGAFDFRIRVGIPADGDTSKPVFYIHPLGHDGDTLFFSAVGNELLEVLHD